MRRVACALLAALALLVGASFAAAETRLALLIGVQDYPSEVGQLSRPHQDVQTLAASLRAVGFEVDTRLSPDADRDGIDDAISAFERRIASAASGGEKVVAFFYFSGHGAATFDDGSRRNFIIPARASVTTASELIRRGMPLDAIIRGFATTEADAVFIVTDACRNDLAPAFTRGAEKGFAPVGQRPGMFIANSTFPGETAPDDGVFADSLAEQIEKPSQYASRAFELAFRHVAATRPGYQLPTAANALLDDFCFNGCPGEDRPSTDSWTPGAAEYRAAQTELRRIGFYSGAIDGLWGAGSSAALQTFQRDNGLSPAGGVLNQASLEALLAAPTPAATAGVSCASHMAACRDSQYGCVNVRIADQDRTPSCTGNCVDQVLARLADAGAARKYRASGGYSGPTACVDFRPDLGGTRAGAECLVEALGPPFALGNCRTDGWPYNVKLY